MDLQNIKFKINDHKRNRSHHINNFIKTDISSSGIIKEIKVDEIGTILNKSEAK
jgi:hypothetical protein